MPDLKVFEELKGTNSIVDKEAILNKRVDDLQLAELLRRNLNPYMLFYIRKYRIMFKVDLYGNLGIRLIQSL